ncbi:MAG TPA: Na+/H+ antiporter NhaC family protein [Tepidanaerobacteraceae bacterium]|nr:Na+/H+ antiporter NhaC family protein [Tepidanaerobacteraceae bacterium]
MADKSDRLTFYGGSIGRYLPLIAALVFVAIAAINQAKIDGYVIAFFAGNVIGLVFAKDQRKYSEAVINGLSKPMFSIIALAVIFAAVSGALVSNSGVIQTLAAYVVKAGLTERYFVGATFILACLISFSTGTSVGTYFVVAPILYPVGCLVGADPAFMIGSIVAGGAFGDNLAPISDTTIASSQTQGMDIGGVVRTRTQYSIPVAVIALILYLSIGPTGEKVLQSDVIEQVTAQVNPLSLLMLVVPVVIIALCLVRKHLITALSYGVLSGIVVSLIFGIYKPADLLSFPAPFAIEGIIPNGIMGCLATIAMLLMIFPLLGIMEANGVISDMAASIGRLAKSRKAAEFSIFLSTGILSMITGVISVAILAVGEFANKVGKKFNIHGYRRANLLDCTGIAFCFIVPWTVHAIVPAMLTSNIDMPGVTAVQPHVIPFHNFYSWVMLLMLIFAIVTGYGSKVEVQQAETTTTAG